jgi:hypothetical protein
MAIQVQLRSGTTPENNVFVGALAEVTVDTDQNTLRVHDGVTPGGVTLATNGYVNTAANNVPFIVNGSTSFTAISSGGNLRANVAGNTVAVISNVGLLVTGTIQATGGFVGLDATKIANGTSQMTINAAGGNILGVVGGVDIFTVSASGISVTGAVTSSGTISGQNIATSGNVAASGTVTSASTMSATGNIVGANFSTSGLITASGNIVGLNFSTAGLITATGNITGGNLRTTGIVTANSVTGNVLSVSGNIIGGQISTAGNVSGNYLLGNGALLTGLSNSFSRIFNGNSEINIGSANGNANISIGGSSNVVNISSTSLALTGIFAINAGSAETAIVNAGTNAVGNIGSASSYFNRIFATSTSALYADLAEMYQADGAYEPGTVVSFGGEFEITQSKVELDPRIAGVVSTNPSYIMNSILDGDNVIPVALTGKVPTKVQGPVQKGDMMVSAGNGAAKSHNNPPMGTVIGKALEDFLGNSGVINIVVGRL